jgi:hypothetical protein
MRIGIQQKRSFLKTCNALPAYKHECIVFSESLYEKIVFEGFPKRLDGNMIEKTRPSKSSANQKVMAGRERCQFAAWDCCSCGHSRGERGSGCSRALSAAWIFVFSIKESCIKQINH